MKITKTESGNNTRFINQTIPIIWQAHIKMLMLIVIDRIMLGQINNTMANSIVITIINSVLDPKYVFISLHNEKYQHIQLQ